MAPEPVASAQEFAERTGNGRVLAFSPSVMMMPALFRQGYWSLTVNGNWRLIFKFDDNDVELVDYLDYH